MAVSVSSSHTLLGVFSILSPLSSRNSIIPDTNSLSFNPITSSNPRRSFIITFSYKSKNEVSIEKKRQLLEQYGLNPDEYLSEPSTKTKKRRDQSKTGSGKQVLLEEPKAPRATHKLLQVVGGTARRKKLLSPKSMDVRPMMEVVKAAAFGILQAAGGCPASLRPGRWLDLYSGTGSVGIEAVSRGCSEVHFVEMDPWVVSDILRPNLEWTGFLDVSVIHTVRVESFLERAEHFLGKDGSFDYISVTPPYAAVDYSILMDQISKSSVVGENTFIVVEYPSRTDMLDSCGCLVQAVVLRSLFTRGVWIVFPPQKKLTCFTEISDRRFGRTHLVIYGPKWAQKKKYVEKTRRKQEKLDMLREVEISAS